MSFSLLVGLSRLGGPFVGQYVNFIVVLVDNMNLLFRMLYPVTIISSNLILCVITNLNASFIEALNPTHLPMHSSASSKLVKIEFSKN